MFSHYHAWLFVTPWTTARQALSMDFLGKNTGVGCHFLLQGVFLTQESNLPLLHWQADSLPLSHLGSSFAWVENALLMFPDPSVPALSERWPVALTHRDRGPALYPRGLANGDVLQEMGGMRREKEGWGFCFSSFPAKPGFSLSSCPPALGPGLW